MLSVPILAAASFVQALQLTCCTCTPQACFLNCQPEMTPTSSTVWVTAEITFMPCAVTDTHTGAILHLVIQTGLPQMTSDLRQDLS